MYRKYFDEVYSGPLFVNKFVVLSHEPIPVSEHFINVHGHLHNSYLDDDHHINVSMKMANYKLLALDDAYAKATDYPRIQAKFLEEWYADKYVFTDLNRKDAFFFKDTGHVIPKQKILELLDDAKKKVKDTESWSLFVKSVYIKELTFLSTDSDKTLEKTILAGFKTYVKFVL